MKTDGEGIIVAIMTPLKDDMEIDGDGVSSLMNFLLEKGMRSFFILGTYGEGLLISRDDREKMLEKVMEVVPEEANVIAHVGAADAKTAFRLAKHAADLGVSAISSVGPIYHRPDKTGLISYYSYLSKSGAPIMVYNNRGRQGYNISPNDFESMVREVPSIVGVKDTSYDVEQLQNYVSRFGEDYYVAGAGDSLITVTFTIGAKAHVCGIANVFPEIPLAIFNAVKEGELRKAVELQGIVNSIRREFVRFGVETQVVLREALRVRGIDIGNSPIPLRKLSEEEKFEVKRISELYIKYVERLK